MGRFEYMHPSGIVFTWEGTGTLHAGIRSRTTGDFLHVDSFHPGYRHPGTEDEFRQLCEDFLCGGSKNALRTRLLHARTSPNSDSPRSTLRA